ncbi:GT4 family glycosyltransferase PelF [Deinococcus planocerae]|uniref:GT4 family glycosyltransferase PelF n=1 Tax=Deinococcus planocerae TaxID=1737569 RepID=UPI000C7F1BE1|nr:GT4 family glycosyltransferase PelF [Deinococcus planocerae]
MTGPAVMVTEGTYPLYLGGVSVWCEQLVSGLHDFDFHVLALSGAPDAVRCALSPNVRQVTVLPLWGEGGARSRGARFRRAAFEEPFARLVGALLSPDQDATRLFTRALGDLVTFAGRHDLNAALGDPRNADLLFFLWARGATLAPGGARPPTAIPAPTLRDALDAALWLAHLLRPLAPPPPEGRLTHAVSNGLAALPALASKHAYGTPFILTEHGVYLRERYLAPASRYLSPGTRAFLLRFYLHLTRAAYAAADIISPASNFNIRWQRHLGADPARIRPVYNGIEPDLFAFPTAGPETPTVAWVGRIDPIKDLETLIRAHALVRAQVPQARLRLFGPVPAGNEAYAARCRDLIGELGLGEHVTFEGRVPTVAQAYAAGHVVALSSISEGFPYSVIEAMATGRPMIATDVGGVREAIGPTGLVVPPRHPEAFAGAVVQLLSDAPRRARLGEEARERVLTMFTVQHCVQAYRQMYTELAHTAPRPPAKEVTHVREHAAPGRRVAAPPSPSGAGT